MRTAQWELTWYSDEIKENKQGFQRQKDKVEELSDSRIGESVRLAMTKKLSEAWAVLRSIHSYSLGLLVLPDSSPVFFELYRISKGTDK